MGRYENKVIVFSKEQPLRQTPIKSFKTKSQALAYAKSYRRKH